MIRAVDVVVPACDEQRDIGGCLAALELARRHLVRSSGGRIWARIAVVLDSCVDGTRDVVSRHGGVETVVSNARSVGVARATGADFMLRNNSTTRSESWLANTDADSRVPENWLTAMISEADRGIHVVLGTVVPDLAPTSAVARRWRRSHLVHEGHPHVHGANFGIRSDIYELLGGWPPLRTGEDVALAERAAASEQVRIARVALTPVVTSSRTHGRAPLGFADYLRNLERESG